MEISAREDIEAPIEFVFDQITDFAGFERSIMRRGGDVERISDSATPAVGMAWQVKFRMRGKERSVRADLTELDKPNGMTITLKSKNADGHTKIELVALSRARTRLNVVVDLTPKTLAAKLLFKSMRFGKQRVIGKFKTLVAGFAEDVDARYRS